MTSDQIDTLNNLYVRTKRQWCRYIHAARWAQARGKHISWAIMALALVAMALVLYELGRRTHLFEYSVGVLIITALLAALQAVYIALRRAAPHEAFVDCAARHLLIIKMAEHVAYSDPSRISSTIFVDNLMDNLRADIQAIDCPAMPRHIIEENYDDEPCGAARVGMKLFSSAENPELSNSMDGWLGSKFLSV